MKKTKTMLLTAIFAFAVFFGFAPAMSTKAATDYHAYLGIQTNDTLWVFRNAYDDEKYGYGTDAFESLHSVSGKNMTAYDGTFTDAALTEDGTYTVALDGPDFAAEKSMSQLFVSTDIPMYDSIKVTDVIVKVDGKSVYTFDDAVLNPESYTYVQILCLNIWNKDVKDLFRVAPTFAKCEITFTITGLNEAAKAQEAYQDFKYKLAKDHATITGYKGSDTSVALPSEIFGKKVTEIATGAFQDSKVKEVKIPDTVTTIGKQAFYNSKLTSITIPKSVTSIKDGAFASCSKLVRANLSAKLATIGKDAFKGDSKLTIYAPNKSVAYEYAVKQGIKVKKS